MHLVEQGRAPIPDGVTFHSLRRTYATLMAALGVDSRYTMAQIGHRSAALPLEVYTDLGDRKHAGNHRLGEQLLGSERAPSGTSDGSGPILDLEDVGADRLESAL